MAQLKRTISLIIALVMTITIPVSSNRAFAIDDTAEYHGLNPRVTVDVRGNQYTIGNGEKAIDYEASQIDIKLDNSYEIAQGRSKDEIKLVANGKYDETYKFDIEFHDEENTVSFNLKDGPPNEDHMHPLRLRDLTLYNIYIPQGLFKLKDSSDYNKDFNFHFVTKGLQGQNDILASSVPTTGKVYEDTGEIIFEFADDIRFSPIITLGMKNKEDYITLETNALDSSLPSYEEDSIENYNIDIDQNRLILKRKDGKNLQEFARYTIRIDEDLVELKNTKSTYIPNNVIKLTFTTYDMLVYTYPRNNQEGVKVEPTIMFNFKYPIKINTSKKIRIMNITSDAEVFSIGEEDIKLSEDKKTLIIDINDLEGHKEYRLRRGTVYKLTIEEGFLEFEDYPIIDNDDLDLYFITEVNGSGPIPFAYSSSMYLNDDITKLEDTELKPDGSIYVAFNKPLYWDKQWYRQEESQSLVDDIKLYRIPKAYETIYDEEGEIFDESFVFNPSEDGEKILPYAIAIRKAPERMEEIINGDQMLIKDASILPAPNNHILKITPKYDLQSLSKYGVIIDERLLEDEYNYNIQGDVTFSFWTEPTAESTIPNWELDNIKAESIKENEDAPYKSYTLRGLPQYGPHDPIILHVDSEVIPKAQDEILYDRLREYRRITFDSLKGISLKEILNPDDAEKNIAIEEYKLQYYKEDNQIKTKIFMYPDRPLDRGERYNLTIAGDVFETRSQDPLPMTTIDFVVEGSIYSDIGIYSITPTYINILDLYKMDYYITIKGYNFNEDIISAVLKPVSGNAVAQGNVAIRSQDIEFFDVTTLKIHLRDEIAARLSTENYSGEYMLELVFINNAGTGTTTVQSPVNFQLGSKERPKVINIYPEGEGKWFDENNLFPTEIDGTTRYFMRITFEDIDGALDFDILNGLEQMKSSSLYAIGGSQVSMIDREFLSYIQNLEEEASKREYVDKYLFKKNRDALEAYLYIPIKLLRPQTTYTVTINPDIVYFSDVLGGSAGNSLIMWGFSTIHLPLVTDVVIGSVVEDYDPQYPVILRGGFFHLPNNVDVYFGTTKAPKTNVAMDPDGYILEVYLPSGKDKLEPGLYDVTVRNSQHHFVEKLGAFSVVPEGDYIPNEEYRVKDNVKEGQVIEDIKVSEDTLILKSRYTDSRKLELNLDELMGSDVLIRKIEVDGRRNDLINELITKSKWANITLYDVSRDSSREEALISLGRTEPVLTDVLKKDLRGRSIKSDFIQVMGDNLSIDTIEIELPYRDSDGANLKVVSYDEISKSWSYLHFTIDKINKTVSITTTETGVFVVIEGGYND